MLFAGVLLGAGMLLAAVAGESGRTAAAEPFLNPGFETWSGASPDSWSFVGSGFSKAAGEGNPGNAVRLTYAGGATGLQHTAVPVQPGAEVAGSIEILGPGVSIQPRLVYLNEGFVPFVTQNGTSVAAGAAWGAAGVTGTAPAGAAYVHFGAYVSTATAGLPVLFDNASLLVTDPEPTPTPIPPMTATPTSTPEEDPTPTPTPTPEGPDDTRTPAPTRTPSPTRTPTGTRTPSPTREATATRTPTVPKDATARATSALATSTPTLKPGSGFGGMLANGDFELVTDGKPAYWEKFGGTMFSDGAAARGSYAACLESDTSSTKWLYQVVPVTGSSWYEASATARLSGGGAVSIRVSWYAAADGSGSQMDQVESNVASTSGWTALATGAVQAPDDANAARVRMVLRPDGPATGCWDDATFGLTEAPATTPVPTVTAGTPARTGTPVPGSTPAATSAASRTQAAGAPGSAVPLVTFPAGGPGALKLSEVMSDPEPGGRDAPFEWVEVVNVSAEAVDLAGWKLGDSSEQQILPSFVVPPQGYVLIAGASAELAPEVPLVRAPGGEIGNGLGNDGDYLELVAPNGETGDELSYGGNTKVFDPAPAAPERALTIGVRDPLADPASENWARTLRPTPGEPNAFPPQVAAGAKGGAAGQSPAPPGGSADQPAPLVVSQGSGGSPFAWVIFALLAGVSMAALYGKFGLRLTSALRRGWRRLIP